MPHFKGKQRTKNPLLLSFLRKILTLFSKEEAAFRMVNTVSIVNFKRMRTAKAILIFSKKSTAQAAVRTISQTVRRDTLGTTGKALRLKSTAHLQNPTLFFLGQR